MKKEINNPICQLNKLQELSEKISDLIYEGNLNQIKILDNERKELLMILKRIILLNSKKNLFILLKIIRY